MKRMLEHSKGDRTVPVIVDGGKVAIGYNGGG
jgi:glutaredoxin